MINKLKIAHLLLILVLPLELKAKVNRQPASASKPLIRTALVEEVTEQHIKVHHQSSKIESSPALRSYCPKILNKFKQLRWGRSFCETIAWNHVRNSVEGSPLIWTVYGNEAAKLNQHVDTTLVLCGVHGDEITPIKFCFDIIHYLEEQFAKNYPNKLIVVAPIVNPDSFFNSKATRTNARGVDINRNFPTKDWSEEALKIWKNRYRSDKRRFPGFKALSEPEVVFQINLIKRYNPDKIISVHAPLSLLDYDGPKHAQVSGNVKGTLAKELLISMSQEANSYKIRHFPYFPGSLGSWAGRERNIPTYTLELPTSDPRHSEAYWKLFEKAIHQAFIRSFVSN